MRGPGRARRGLVHVDPIALCVLCQPSVRLVMGDEVNASQDRHPRAVAGRPQAVILPNADPNRMAELRNRV